MTSPPGMAETLERIAPDLHDLGEDWWLIGSAAMVLHGAVSAELYVDCNAEGFFLLAKFAHILEPIREKMPTFMNKTSELVNRFTAAAARYEGALKNVEARRRKSQPEQEWQVR